ncbi:MAG TPA: translocation/assembly module TamB domain-containing protein [Candidatus Omnitrophota bacterium]|nr:translocation/assembly module TamB domain-containing protein [Candidatus Omnitrophota bacterium]HSA31999.1 translocation/assembly module TamB domain-containing protein [Candidatus Omnitrophota bacterium]
MNSAPKKYFISIIIIISGLLLLLASVLFLGLTTTGSSYITNRFLSGLVQDRQVDWKKNEGNLVSGITYENVEVHDLDWFPIPNILRAQKITISLSGFSWKEAFIDIDHARLILPNADPIIVSGQMQSGILNFNLYSKTFSLDQIRPLITSARFSNISGELSEIDLVVTGSIYEPQASGAFRIEKASKDGFSIAKTNCTLDLAIKTTPIGRGLFGSVLLSEGTASGQKTAKITLQKGRVIFDGNPLKPSFNIKASSRVERTKMEITLTGTLEQPNLQIISDPPLSKERALVALATNKTWKASNQLFETGTVTPEMTREFLDYFFFPNTGSTFAQRFGLTELSVTFTEGTKGLSAGKAILPRLQGTYEVQSQQKQNSPPNITQKIGGEFLVTDSLSVEAKKEIKRQDPLPNPLERPEDEIFLKYKKTF